MPEAPDARTDPTVPGCPWCGAQPAAMMITDPLRCPSCGKVIIREGGQLLKGEEPAAVPAAPPAAPAPAAAPAAPAAPVTPPATVALAALKLDVPHILRMPMRGPEPKLVNLDASQVIAANIYLELLKINQLLTKSLANQERALGVMAPPPPPPPATEGPGGGDALEPGGS